MDPARADIPTALPTDVWVADAFDAVPTGLLLVDPEGTITRVNNAVAQLLGRARDDLLGRRLHEIVSEDSRPLVALLLEQLRASRDDEVVIELSLARSDGGSVPARFLAAQRSGPSDDVVIHAVDLREQQQLRDKLAYVARHDAVTGLPNRELSLDLLRELLESRPGRPMLVMAVDLDRFRVTNDHFGHLVGDQVLAGVGERLRSLVAAKGGHVARLAADEFLLVCPCEDHTDAASAETDAAAVRAAVAEPMTLRAARLHLSATVGATVHDGAFDDDGREDAALRLVQRAEIALHQARRTGRPISVLDPAGAAAVERWISMESALSQTLDTGDVDVVFQPILDCRHNDVVGVEALVRWGDAEAADMVDIAERSGGIILLGRIVRDRAFARLGELSSAAGRPLHLSVNMSAVELQADDVVQGLLSQMATHNIPASQLTVELTETAAMRDLEGISKTLAELRSNGISVAIDDFGTGYSSLSYLKDLPVDEVKIDRSFLTGLADPSARPEFFRGVVGLCRGLGFEVVGEGVEDAAQLRLLSDAGCTRWQGYLASKPLSGDTLVRLLEDGLSGRTDVPRSLAPIAAETGFEDIFVFGSIDGGRYAHLGGIGSGAGWAGIVHIDPEAEQRVVAAMESHTPQVVDLDAPVHIVGPYYAARAVIAAEDDWLVVLGGGSGPIPHPADLSDRCARAARSVSPLSPSSPLADEVELLDAVQHLLRGEGLDRRSALRHLCTTAADALGCEVAVAWTPDIGLVIGRSITRSRTADAALHGWLAGVGSEPMRCAQRAADGDMPPGLAADLQIASWLRAPIVDGGVLLLAHTADQPRGFTGHCQRITNVLVDAFDGVYRGARERDLLRREIEAATNAASRDPLTGVRNRVAWDAAVDRAEQRSSEVSVLLFDILSLRALNARFGHAVGDLALQSVARALENVVRGSDVLARLASDDFAMLLPGVDDAARRFVQARAEEQLRQLSIGVHGAWVDVAVGGATATTGDGVRDAIAAAARRASDAAQEIRAQHTEVSPGRGAIRGA